MNWNQMITRMIMFDVENIKARQFKTKSKTKTTITTIASQSSQIVCWLTYIQTNLNDNNYSDITNNANISKTTTTKAPLLQDAWNAVASWKLCQLIMTAMATTTINKLLTTRLNTKDEEQQRQSSKQQQSIITSLLINTNYSSNRKHISSSHLLLGMKYSRWRRQQQR